MMPGYQVLTALAVIFQAMRFKNSFSRLRIATRPRSIGPRFPRQPRTGLQWSGPGASPALL
jgi:hypothetical protein